MNGKSNQCLTCDIFFLYFGKWCSIVEHGRVSMRIASFSFSFIFLFFSNNLFFFLNNWFKAKTRSGMKILWVHYLSLEKIIDSRCLIPRPFWRISNFCLQEVLSENRIHRLILCREPLFWISAFFFQTNSNLIFETFKIARSEICCLENRFLSVFRTIWGF